MSEYQTQMQAALALLAQQHSLDMPQISSLLEQQLPAGAFLDKLCVVSGIAQEELYQALESVTGIPFVRQIKTSANEKFLEQIPQAMAKKRLLIPYKKSADGIITLTPELDPVKRQRAVKIVESRLGKPVIQFCTFDEFQNLVEKSYSRAKADTYSATLSDISPMAAAQKIIDEAINLSATDIHIEPLPDLFRIRMRVDGRLIDYALHLDTTFAQGLIQRIKVLAGMDITENRKPQDGSFVHNSTEGTNRLDIRSATAPTRYGERVTLRLLGLNTANLHLENLGFSPVMYDEINTIINKPHGLFLIAGPTGSGKSTTLYAALAKINHPDKNLMTVEDPVEYSIAGISQMQVDSRSKLTFSSALRSMLRHDPDVLMVGEIRDGETASIALRSSITGHMVFSTIHSNTAVGSITRLVDMGCEPHIVAAAMSGCLSQRLVRRICPNCREECVLDESQEAIRKFIGGERHFVGNGCPACNGEGFSGRAAVFEFLSIGEVTRNAIRTRESEHLCQAYASLYVSLREDGVEKVKQGITTPQEIIKISDEW